MGPISFVHLGFLAAGATAAIPLIIHLLFRQKTRVIPIGSVRFLQQVIREHQRRRRVRQWLLLALRILAVLLLALLFARPYWDEAARRGAQRELIVMIDRSASMAVRDARGETSFDRARNLARAELAQLDENVVVHVALCDAEGVSEISLDALAQAAPSALATDYGVALAWCRDVFAQSQRSDRRVVLMTDLQRSGLPATAPPTLPADVDFQLRDVGEPLPRNVAVERAEAVRVEIRPGDTVAARVVLRNHGPVPVTKLLVNGEVTGPEGTVRSQSTVDLAARASSNMELPFNIRTDGLYQGRVWIEANDALALDDERWLAFTARRPDRVLLVDGQEGRSVFANETYFLETALRLRGDDGQAQAPCSFEVERLVWEAGQGFPRLDGYRAVVLANVRRFRDEDALRLRTFLQAGGGVLVFAGDQVTASTLAPLVEAQLMPGTVAPAPLAQRRSVTQFDAQHPALAPFADPQHGDLRRLDFRRFLPLDQLADNARVLLHAGPEVLAAERPVGRGRLLYVGLTADRDWTDWPRTRLFVPLVRQWLAYLTDQLGGRSRIESREIAHHEEKPGITQEGEQWIVRNVAARESALDRLKSEEFQTALGVSATPQSITAEELASLPVAPAQAFRPAELWMWLVALLLGILAAELWLAGQIHA